VKKPTLSFWQIWNMSFGFLGIQFGFALQNSNVSRIFETLGAKIDEIPILWIAAPVTGLIIQPIIGHYSDKTWTKLGRRRPFFLFGAILASLALILMPNSSALWMAAGLLWIMDASINVSMEPFRAFVGDLLPDEQRNLGFTMQSFFIGIGAIVASALPYIMDNVFHVPNTASKGQIPLSVKLSFYIGAIVYFSAVLWTVISTKEYSPEEIKQFEDNNITENEEISKFPSGNKLLKDALIWMLSSVIGYFFFLFTIGIDLGLKVFFGMTFFYGILQLITLFFVNNKKNNSLVEIINDLHNIPTTMRQLAVVQFFTWFALFAMWIYTTQAVTSHIFKTSDPTSQLYNFGANWVGILFAVYNGFAAISAFVINSMANKFQRKYVHMFNLILGALGLLSFYFITNYKILVISMLGVGVAWASILSMPYAILTKALPQNKMGVYMGIFNFFIVIPQITAAAILGFFMKTILHEQAINALILGGFSMIIAALLCIRIKEK
jgi:maltose/moltooligosaccharide transporter